VRIRAAAAAALRRQPTPTSPGVDVAQSLCKKFTFQTYRFNPAAQLVYSETVCLVCRKCSSGFGDVIMHIISVQSIAMFSVFFFYNQTSRDCQFHFIFDIEDEEEAQMLATVY
jgi:hypothetical protein